MGYGVSGGEPHRILLKDFDGSDNWVDIKPGRSSGAVTRIQFAGASITGIDGNGQPIYQLLDEPLLKMRVQLFVEAIVAWSLKADDADPDVMPLNRDVYAETLDGQLSDWLDTQITAFYNRRRFNDDTLGNSNGPSIAP